MDLHTIKAWEGVILSGFSIIISVWAFMKWIWPKVKRGYQRTHALFLGIEEMPKVLASIQSVDNLNTQVGVIMKQVMPNGGASLADSLNRVESKLSANVERAESINKTVELMAATMRATSNTNPRMATFETSASGMLIDCNKTYLRWTGRTLDEMLNWGWINCVHPDDKVTVRREWLEAVADVRQSVLRYRMLDEDGGCFKVEVTATPIPEGALTCEKWVGVIYLEERDAREKPVSCTIG